MLTQRSSYSALIVILILLPVAKSFSQIDTVSSPPITVNEVILMGGVLPLPSYGNTMSMFHKLAPTSELLAADLSQYEDSYEAQSHSLGVFNAGISLQFADKNGIKRRNPLLRLGITYQGGQLLGKKIKYETRSRYDTLISSQTGAETYIDSVYTKSIDMRYRTSQIMADVAVIWRTDPKFQWSLYTGLGMAGGTSFDNRTVITNTTSNHTSNVGRNYYPEDGLKEVVRNDNGYSLLAYLPIGFGLSMSKSGFGKTLIFIVEMRPGISVISIPELETNVNAVFPVSFGFKVSW